MNKLKILGLASLLFVSLGLGACATSPEEKDTGVPGTMEVEPSMEELERQEMEELSRMEQEELDAMREDQEAQKVRAMEFAAGALQTVNFGFDRYSLTPEAREKLAQNAEWLKQNPEIIIQVEGHCDERGTDEYNLALGEKRATSAKSYLVSLGVDPARIYTISYGEERPVDPGHNREAWAKNRRADFKLTTP